MKIAWITLALMAAASAASPALAVDPVPLQAAEVEKISAEVVVLHATNDGSGIDPRIGKMPALEKPPFSAYDSYKLLDRADLSLAKQKPSTHKLPTKRDLQLVYKDVIVSKKGGKPKKYLVNASIQKAGSDAFLPLVEVKARAGEYFFVAGEKYKGGILVIGIKVK